MARLQRTSRYFLEHLLPWEALDATQRRAVRDVLLRGDAAAQRDLARDLVEALARVGRFERVEEGCYRDRQSGRQLRFRTLPLAELPDSPLSGNGSTPSPALPPAASARSAAAAAAPAPEPLRDESVPPSAARLLGSRLSSILEAVQLEGREPGLNENLTRLLDLLDDWFPGSSHVLYRVDPQERDESNGAFRELEPETLAPGHPYREAMQGGEPRRLDPRREDLGWYPPRGSSESWTWLLQPLRLGEETWGLMELRLPSGQDADAALHSLRLLGRALSHQVHNHRVLSRVVYVDWLTQVFNRSFLELQLPLEIERATRNDEPMALLVVDLDDFKQINDRCGHDVGDRVLKEFSRVIRKTLRKVDQVFRYGGEEFVVLLPRLDRETAFRAAERLRKAVARHDFDLECGGDAIQITASLGGAIFPTDAVVEHALFKAADDACYRAKGEGKNKVVFVEQPAGGGED